MLFTVRLQLILLRRNRRNNDVDHAKFDNRVSILQLIIENFYFSGNFPLYIYNVMGADAKASHGSHYGLASMLLLTVSCLLLTTSTFSLAFSSRFGCNECCRFRAYTPREYHEQLLQYLQGNSAIGTTNEARQGGTGSIVVSNVLSVGTTGGLDDSTKSNGCCCVEFAVRWRDLIDTISAMDGSSQSSSSSTPIAATSPAGVLFFHQLPASKVTIVVVGRNQPIVVSTNKCRFETATFRQQVNSALIVWTAFGNVPSSCATGGGAGGTFGNAAITITFPKTDLSAPRKRTQARNRGSTTATTTTKCSKLIAGGNRESSGSILRKELYQMFEEAFGWTRRDDNRNHGQPNALAIAFQLGRCETLPDHGPSSASISDAVNDLGRHDNCDSDGETMEDHREEFFTLELVTLRRLYPLRIPSLANTERKNGHEPTSLRTASRAGSRAAMHPPPTMKRIESFAVAMTADIQPYETVLDPMCHRGTLLVEAAKYWPLASYHGIDQSLSHLEHVTMNARSCQVASMITLEHQPPCASRGVTEPRDRCHHRWRSTKTTPTVRQQMKPRFDKIMTCLPFGRSKGEYATLLRKWSHVYLKRDGKMAPLLTRRHSPCFWNPSRSIRS